MNYGGEKVNRTLYPERLDLAQRVSKRVGARVPNENTEAIEHLLELIDKLNDRIERLELK